MSQYGDGCSQKGRILLGKYYRAVSRQIEKVPGVMLNQEVEMADLRGVICFGKLDMLQGYWQMLLAAEAQKVFSIAPPRRSVYPHACAPRPFEYDGLIPRCDDRVVGWLELQGLD